MAYDNTKLDIAVQSWISRDCVESFGETYAGDLLQSFEKFCAETGAMNRSPGRVAFGKALGRRNYEKRKLCGLTYWNGILLEKPIEMLQPRENSKSADTLRMEAKRARAEKEKLRQQEKEAARKARAAEVKRRMKAENKKHNLEIGKLPVETD